MERHLSTKMWRQARCLAVPAVQRGQVLTAHAGCGGKGISANAPKTDALSFYPQDGRASS